MIPSYFGLNLDCFLGKGHPETMLTSKGNTLGENESVDSMETFLYEIPLLLNSKKLSIFGNHKFLLKLIAFMAIFHFGT